MLINYGFDITITVPQTTPVITLLDIHDSRRVDIRSEGPFITRPEVPVKVYRDLFGNICRRMVVPPGTFGFTLDGTISDSGAPDFVDQTLGEVPIPKLPDD